MKHAEWSRPVSNAEAARRAGARDAYNRERQCLARDRQARLERLLRRPPPGCRTWEDYAAALGVSRSTLWRDREAIEAHRLLWHRYPSLFAGEDA